MTPTTVMCLVIPEDPRAIENIKSVRLGQHDSTHTVEPRVSTACLSIGQVLLCDSAQGKDVTAEDGTDSPVESSVFNPPRSTGSE
jgi:hypothetical protein